MNTEDSQNIDHLRILLRDFAKERDWDQFHSPKNLVMALTGEVGELTEHFQWLSAEDAYTEINKDAVAEEMADVLLYLTRLADRLDINLLDASYKKLELNKKKYPVEKVKGSYRKYNDYNE